MPFTMGRDRTELEARAAHGDADAALALGEAISIDLRTGELGERELASATAAFRSGASAGSQVAQWGLDYLRLIPLSRRARAGDAGAAYRLGRRLQRQRVVWPPLLDAREAFEIATRHDHARAAYELGMILEHSDRAAACDALRIAADRGVPDAAAELGRILAFETTPPELSEARSALERAVAGGSPGADFNLALLLERLWSPPDLEAACHLYRAVADRGDLDAGVNAIDAGINLGAILGWEVDPPDLEGAREALEQATSRALAEQLNLRPAMGSGLDLGKPGIGLLSLFQELANVADHLRAPVMLGILASRLLDPPDLSAARTALRAATRWGDPRAAEHLLPVLQTIFGTLSAAVGELGTDGSPDARYERGLILSRYGADDEHDQACADLQAACHDGHVGAATELGSLLLRGSPPDARAARDVLAGAAGTGCTEAARELGLLLAGSSTVRDVDTAISALRCAQVGGDAEGAYQLGRVLALVRRPPDLDGSVHALQRTARLGHPRAEVALADVERARATTTVNGTRRHDVSEAVDRTTSDGRRGDVARR